MSGFVSGIASTDLSLTPLSATINIPAGHSRKLLVVDVGLYFSSDQTIASVVGDPAGTNVTPTQRGTTFQINADRQLVARFYFTDSQLPASGNFLVQVNISGPTGGNYGADEAAMLVRLFDDVNQSTPFRGSQVSGTTAGTTATQNISTIANDYVIDSLVGYSQQTATPNHTATTNAIGTAGATDCMTQWFAATTTTTTMSWSGGGSETKGQLVDTLIPDTGGGASAIPGKTIQSKYSEGEDRSFFSSSKLTKPQAGGAAPPGASKLGKVFQGQFNDILGYDFVSSSKQTKGQPGGAAPPGATILGKSFVNNPAPNPEAEWDYANGVFVSSASPGVATTPNVPNLIPKVNANPLFIDYEDFSQYQSKVIRGQPGVPPVIGLPRHSYINIAATAAQIVDDNSMFISRFGVKASYPAKGIIPAPPVTNVISGVGLVGAGTMRGN